MIKKKHLKTQFVNYRNKFKLKIRSSLAGRWDFWPECLEYIASMGPVKSKNQLEITAIKKNRREKGSRDDPRFVDSSWNDEFYTTTSLKRWLPARKKLGPFAAMMGFHPHRSIYSTNFFSILILKNSNKFGESLN